MSDVGFMISVGLVDLNRTVHTPRTVFYVLDPTAALLLHSINPIAACELRIGDNFMAHGMWLSLINRLECISHLLMSINSIPTEQHSKQINAY